MPAVLDVPEVVQDADFEGDRTERPTPGWYAPQQVHPDPRSVETAVRLLRTAERPVIVAGAGAVAAVARDEILRLGTSIGALLSTTINARGLFHGEPYDAGVAGGFASQPATELFRQADLVISFGAGMDKFVTRGGTLFPDASHVQVDLRSPRPTTGGAAADCYAQGDAAVVAGVLANALAEGPSRTGFRTQEVADRLDRAVDPVAFEFERNHVDPRELCSRLDELLPEHCGWVSGNSGHFWAFPIMHMRRWRQPMIYASYFGAIGYGLPVGLGAAIGNDGRPLVVFEGDAGVIMHVQALETAARYGVRILVVVLNDGALGAEYHSMAAEGYDTKLSLTPDLDIAGLARQLGSRAATVTELDQLPGLVSEFLATPGPMLLDARVSRRVISPPMRRSTYHWED